MKITLFSFLPIVLLFTSCGSENNRASVMNAQLSQEANMNEYERGQLSLYELKEMGEDRSVPDFQNRARKLFEYAKEIDKLTKDQIVFLENLKISLLKELGENVSTEGGENDVVKRRSDITDPLRPAVYALYNVKYSGTTDFIDYESGNGKEIVRRINAFRKAITEKVAVSSSVSGGSWHFNAPDINDYADSKELFKRVDQSIKQSNVSPDDQEMVKRMYIELTFKSSAWRDMLNSDCPWEDVFAILTSLQYKVLQARADALTVIRQRVAGSAYSFDQILALTPGPEYAGAGTSSDFEVMMAAFNSYNEPIVKITSGNATVSKVKGGIATVHVELPERPGEVTVKGTITIMNKSGIPKTQLWQKTIVTGE